MSTEVYSASAIKRAAWYFLTGKALTAGLTFIILLWLVRLLPLVEYGTYVVLIAGTELGFAVAGLGLHWLAARFLPDYRLHSDGLALARICRLLILWQVLALAVLVGVLFIAMDAYLSWVGLSGHQAAARLALLLMVAEGLGRFLREGLMAPLLLQGQARRSLVLRQLIFLVGIAALVYTKHATLLGVLAAEASASVIALAIAAIGMVRHLQTLRGQTAQAGWQEPSMSAQWRIALRMHAAHVVTLAYGPQIFLNLIQRSLGAEAAALFGFIRLLSDQVARYLPALLLFSVLRPMLMASHIQGGMKALAPQVNLMGKLSLFVLLPILVLVALAGDTLVGLLSGSKFTGGGAYLLWLLLALVPFSQRQLLETVAVAAGRAGLCTLGAVLGLIALPLMLHLVDLELGLWAPVVAILFGQFSFNATVLIGLSPMGYQPDWLGAAKLAASAFLAWFVAEWVLHISHGVTYIVASCLVGAGFFLAMAWRLQAFTPSERQRLANLFGRRLLAR